MGYYGMGRQQGMSRPPRRRGRRRGWLQRRTTRWLVGGFVLGVAATAVVAVVAPEVFEATSSLTEWAGREDPPPTQEQVRQRAERLERRGVTVALMSGICLEALEIAERTEERFVERFGVAMEDVTTDQLGRLLDTRQAMAMLDEQERFVKDVEKACLE